MQFQFDAKDDEIRAVRMAERDAIDRPRRGDYVRFPTGEVERFSNEFGTALQTSPIWAGSFHLHAGGVSSFSGSLNPPIPADSLTLTTERMDGKFWFFHHGETGAHRGVYFAMPCRVYETTAPYHGFVSRGFTDND